MSILAILFLLAGPTADTIAGTGKPGHTGDGGPALKATLDQPFQVELDGTGHLYVAEAGSHCIRKINLETGIISTVAGTGKKGYSGDGGPATQATFNEPYAVAVTKAGDLYIADRLNAAIRKVDGNSGIVTTVVARGKLVEPNDVCLDGKGGLLIADVGAWRIERVDLKTGAVTTFAGIGRPAKAGKGYPRAKVGDGGPAIKAVIVGARAVCVDGRGNTYICEREGSTIRKVDSSGTITTIAGTGAWGYAPNDGRQARDAVFKGPKGIRADRAGNLFVVDTENNAIRQIEVKTGTIYTMETDLHRPHGCVVDRDGSLYIADTNSHCIRARIAAP